MWSPRGREEERHKRERERERLKGTKRERRGMDEETPIETEDKKGEKWLCDDGA